MAMSTVFLLLLVGSSVCWSRPQSSDESSAHCDSCRQIAGFTRRLLDTNSISDVKANLTKWCLSEGPASQEVCSRYIDAGISVLQRVGVDSFCGKIGACESDSIPEDQVSLQDYADQTSCDFCLNVITHVKGIVSDPQTEKEFERALARSCDHCPVKDECIAVLDKNIANVFKCLRDHMDPKKFCTSTGYCSVTDNAAGQRQSGASVSDVIGVLPVETHQVVPFTEIQPADTVTSPNGNPMNCLICKQVAVWAIKKLKDNRTEEAIVQTLDQVCDRVFSKGKQTECEAFVKQYTDELIGIFKETDDPRIICILLGVCDKGMTLAASSEAVAHCTFCQDASRRLLNRIQFAQSDLEIHQEVTGVCSGDSVPESIRPVCQDFVSENDALIESLVKQTQNPNLICWKLNACRDVWRGSSEREVLEDVRSLPSCFICKEIAKWVNQQVKQNRTEESIEAALSTVCKFMKNVHNCQDKVNDWSSRLIIVLRQASQPELACELLQVCGFPSNGIETEGDETAVSPKTSVAGGVCYECQTITHFIQEELYSYDKEKRAEDFVIKNVCDKITADVGKETCESFVNQYGPAVMQLIAMKVFDSKVVCEKELHICPKTLPSNPSTDVEVSSQNTCSMCTTSVQELDSLLSSGSVDREISKLAAAACAKMPQQDQRQCTTLIKAFGPYFLQMIGRMSNPRQVCKELDLCSDPGEVQLLGGHKCSYGPSYWCHTIAHASACKAEDYCRRVWEPIEQTE